MVVIKKFKYDFGEIYKKVPKYIIFLVYNNDQGRERRYARKCFSRFKY